MSLQGIISTPLAMPTISYLNQFPIEKPLSLSLHTIPLSFLILGLIEFFLIYWVTIYEYFLRSHSFDTSKVEVGKSKLDVSESSKRKFEKIDDGSLNREEVEMVMGKIGFFCHPHEDAKLQERFGSEDLSRMFEEKEPGLDEVKGAFDVFDENRDGFIDAGELQRVLSALGLKERAEMDNCKRMISVFDENGDERIDFNEFVKLMENSFC